MLLSWASARLEARVEAAGLLRVARYVVWKYIGVTSLHGYDVVVNLYGMVSLTERTPVPTRAFVRSDPYIERETKT